MGAVVAENGEGVLAVTDDQERQQPCKRVEQYMDNVDGAQNDRPVKDSIAQPRQRRTPEKVQQDFLIDR